MPSPSADFGLIGLAVMGENLALNVESRGYTVAVFNRTTEKVDDLINGRAKGKKFVGCHSLQELVQSVKRPRKIMMMVKAGQPVRMGKRTGTFVTLREVLREVGPDAVLARNKDIGAVIYMTRLTAPAVEWGETQPARLEPFQAGARFRIGDIEVQSFGIPHDAIAQHQRGPHGRDAHLLVVRHQHPRRGHARALSNVEAAALREFLGDVEWGPLDFLLLDLPPGMQRYLELCDILGAPPLTR